MTAWTKAIALGLLLCPFGCEVHVDGGNPDLGYGGDYVDYGGSGGVSGNAGRSGEAGRGGQSGSGGTAANAGAGGMSFITPTCSAEAGDANDECVRCLKAQCCSAWQGCADQTCSAEWQGTASCMEMLVMNGNEFPSGDEFAMCVSDNSMADDGLPQENTNNLYDCINREDTSADAGGATRCGIPCFGADVAF